MSARLPESRIIAQKTAQSNGSNSFASPKSLEIFSSFAHMRKTNNRLVCLSLGDQVPLGIRPFEWPLSTKALCLHCSESCPSTPFPAVKYHDAKDDKYWVYGYFCRPCCALAYVAEHPNTDTGRCLLWTQTALRKYFNVSGLLSAAPPRASLEKFGGTLGLDEFYGNSGTNFKILHTPPFVTFAMYAEMTKTETAETSVDRISVKNLTRPLQRSDSIAVQDQTGKPPLILEFLASKGAENKTSQVSAKPIEPKRKSAKISTQVKESGAQGLSMYIVD